MAIKIKVEDTAALSRQDTFRIAPSDAKRGRNSRMVPAPDYAETVLKRAQSIAEHGQLQPAEVRRLDDNSLELVAGYTRADAVQLLRDGFTAIDPKTGEKKEYKDEKATLWVKVVDVTADEAFLRSITENLQRKDTTDLQEALAQNELRVTQGWTDSMIARFYGKTNQNRVAALAKLLLLPDDVQQKVHTGKLALYSALDTLDLDPETRANLLDGATDDTGKVQGATLRKLLRDHYDATGDAPAAEAPEAPETGETPDADPKGAGVEKDDSDDPKAKKHVKRNVKDLERFYAEKKEEAGDALSPAAGELLDIMVLWFKGRRTDKYLADALNAYTVGK